ncbi:hypothetical protein SAMN05216249_10264 [Acetitomaculum ruminis DSM 5522]|uniref:Flagellar hook-associated protein 2 C-terminus n=1 Tax=Acetitomaculum ruminis DSM 5522 TaxID=1120918 RepID=A0A1I0VKG9_9FIRM|nr:hypothetical protein [Acetitomaculum ruminis]SFA76905.1 hypothetical protein SAMN05216249_10264 [Acetitomaculum ruminis DSM 5522]
MALTVSTMSDSSSVSTLFSGLGKNNYTSKRTNSSQNDDFSLSMYGSLRNGSYRKLVKAYYAKETKTSQSVTSDDKTATKNSYAKLKTDTSNLKTVADSLAFNSSLFDKKEVTKEDGTTESEYDMDTLYSKAKSFVESYNSSLEDFDKINNSRMLQQGVFMTKATKTFEAQLKKIGITIGEENKLSIDEKTFKEGSVHDVKALFYGSGSYASKIGNYASKVEGYAATAVSKISGLYTNEGSYLKGLNSTSVIDAYF